MIPVLLYTQNIYIGKFYIFFSNNNINLYKKNKLYSILYRNIIYYNKYKYNIEIKFHKKSTINNSDNKLSTSIIVLKFNNIKITNNMIDLISIKKNKFKIYIYNPIHQFEPKKL